MRVVIGYSCTAIGGNFNKDWPKILKYISQSKLVHCWSCHSCSFSRHETVSLQSKWSQNFAKSANDYISSCPNP